MAYISGSQSTFETRLHEFPVSTGELASYLLEYNNQYTGLMTSDLKSKLNREYIKKELSIANIVDTGVNFK